jgi:glycosyltransferase involved in cell wall biosynthesis
MTETITPPTSRNDPCPCGSGKRYKYCHGLNANTPQNAAPIDPIAEHTLHLAQNGLFAQEKGRLEEAETLYRQSLELAPNNPDVLHMLGVVRMQLFDYAEARKLIDKAGTLVDWKFPSFRHNRAHLLSAYLSGRSRSSLVQRIERLKSQRSVRPKINGNRIGLILVGDATNNLDSFTFNTAEGFTTPPIVYTTAPIIESQAMHLSPHLLFAASIIDAINKVTRDEVDLVIIAPQGTRFSANLVTSISDFTTQGAAWGLLASALEVESLKDESRMRVRDASVSRLSGSRRVGASLLDDIQLQELLAVTIWECELLKEISSTYAPTTVFDLAFHGIRLDEPTFLNRVVATIPFESSHAWWRSSTNAFNDYVQFGLTDSEPKNHLAPCKAVDGLGFLKRALRVWIGAHLKPETLDNIATQIDNAEKWRSLRNDGAEFIGFARAESGLGESMRLLVRAARTVDLNCAVGDVALDVGMRQSDDSVSELITDTPIFRNRIICVNPDSLGEAIHLDGVGAFSDCYQIGYWYWELERIPKRWADAAKMVNEIWVASDFVANAVKIACNTVVRIITPPLLAPRLARDYRRKEFELPDEAFVFLFSFAYGSFASRKNPEAAVRAFRTAFPRSMNDVRLVIKTSQSELFLPQVEALMQEAAGDSRITFVNRYLSRDELTGLQSVSDCYISLHRSEGLGLGMAEAMSLGKPTIGTAYSGNLAFMNERNSLLVDYKMIPIKPGEYIDADGQSWADADIEDAAKKMRFLYENRAEAKRIGLLAKKSLGSDFSLATVGVRIRNALDEIGH